MSKFVVELAERLWLAPVPGEPGRTRDIEKATHFTRKSDAEEHLRGVQSGTNRFNNAKVARRAKEER